MLSGKSPGNKDFRSGTSEHRRHILMDTLLLTCHFLFEQKQLSPQTPCSGGLWVLLAGSDLFTQPRDKSGSPSSPWSNTHQQQHHSPHSHAVPPAPPTPLKPPRQHPGQDVVPDGASQRPPSEVHLEPPCARGVGPGLIRSSMMK